MISSNAKECMFKIRCIKVEEIDRMPEWIYKEVGWTNNDSIFLKICYDIDPKGWFVAVTSDEDIIGTLLSVNLNDQYSFAGLYLVSKKHRFKGIGKILQDIMCKHVAHRCLGVNSVEERVSSNLKIGMIQSFKVAIFKGCLIRNAPIFHFLSKYKSIDDHKPLNTVANGMICNQKIQCNAKDQHQCNKIEAKKPVTYLTTQTDLKNNSVIDQELEKKQTICEKGYNDNSHPFLDDKLSLKYNSLNTNDDLSKHRHDSLQGSDNISLILKDGMDINFSSLCNYDAAIHGGIPREIFLKAFIQLSAKSDNAIKCIVALKKSEMMANDKQALSDQICGYGIIRPRWRSLSTENELITFPNTKNLTPLISEHHLIIGPLYADNPEIAKIILKALLDTVPYEWKINVELTVPFKIKDEVAGPLNDSTFNPNFLYMTATKELGLSREGECFRMYKNDIMKTLNRNEEDESIKNVDKKIDLIPFPNILMEKVYSLVSLDYFLI
ncbi:unnamed protein product [Gordionus sp. m RMFG-2023]|uniref:uncharacterized protein LOC135924857 n=1 Tax=Gordionus sp. m RMFG-2023 TaxID=3053472 RepID=UPI0030E23933